MSIQETFVALYEQYIHREGADKFLDYLVKSPIFSRPRPARGFTAPMPVGWHNTASMCTNA